MKGRHKARLQRIQLGWEPLINSQANVAETGPQRKPEATEEPFRGRWS